MYPKYIHEYKNLNSQEELLPMESKNFNEKDRVKIIQNNISGNFLFFF